MNNLNMPQFQHPEQQQQRRPSKVEFLGMTFDIETFKFVATTFYYLMIFITVYYSFKFFFVLVRKVHESGEAKAEKYLKEKRGEAEPVSGENDDDKKGKKTKQKTETKKKQ